MNGFLSIKHRGEKIRVIGRHHFLVKSKSEKGWHCVDLGYVDYDWPEGGCTCTGFTVRKDCRHYRACLSLFA